MSRGNKLETIAMLAANRVDEAARALQEMQRLLDENQTQLTSLKNYKLEYQKTLSEKSAQGMSSAEFKSVHQFVGSLDGVVQMQANKTANIEVQCQKLLENWQAATIYQKSIEKIQQRTLLAEQAKHEKALQKLSDEHVTQKYIRERR